VTVLALEEAPIGERGPTSAEHNRAVNRYRTAGIDFWTDRIGRPLTEYEEDAIVVLADGLVRAREER
jgi:hypothetical protein